MNNKYTMHFNVKCYMTDYNHNLRPAAFLDCAQDIATDAAAEINLGDPTLRPLGCVWVVARMHTQFLRPVKFNEKVSMSSWHKGIRGVNFLRDYQLCGADGAPAVNSTSSWIVMDMKTRMLSRDQGVWEIINREPQSTDSAIEEPSPKILMPKSGEISLIGTHKVQWSDVDFNKHANNVKYTVWAMDALPPELIYNSWLKEHFINFNKEVRPGETVELYHAETDGTAPTSSRAASATTRPSSPSWSSANCRLPLAAEPCRRPLLPLRRGGASAGGYLQWRSLAYLRRRSFSPWSSKRMRAFMSGQRPVSSRISPAPKRMCSTRSPWRSSVIGTALKSGSMTGGTAGRPDPVAVAAAEPVAAVLVAADLKSAATLPRESAATPAREPRFS